MLAERPRLGFIGLGSVAYHMAKGLHEEEGYERILAYCDGPRNRPPYTPAFKDKAAGAGVTLVNTLAELATGSDLILSAVTAASTLDVVQQTAPHLTPRHMFVDMNSASPEVKERAAEMCAARGATFVDCVILGGPSMLKHHVLLWTSAPGGDVRGAWRNLRGLRHPGRPLHAQAPRAALDVRARRRGVRAGHEQIPHADTSH